MKTRIVTITDCADVASNEIHAVLVTTLDKLNASERVVVEPFVHCQEFSLLHGAFLTRLLADSYSADSIVFLVIVNALPTSRAERARIIGKTEKGHRFVGENTGVFNWLFQDYGVAEVYEASRKGLDGQEFIPFGGKHFHAPNAALVASDKTLFTFGPPYSQQKLATLEIPTGSIVHIDNFGVAKIKSEMPSLKEGESVQIFRNDEYLFKAVFTHSMKNLPDNTQALYRGSSFNLIEIGCVRNTKKNKNLLKVGDIISFKKERENDKSR
jgi:S-adenosylmethionine hydrolase